MMHPKNTSWNKRTTFKKGLLQRNPHSTPETGRKIREGSLWQIRIPFVNNNNDKFSVSSAGPQWHFLHDTLFKDRNFVSLVTKTSWFSFGKDHNLSQNKVLVQKDVWVGVLGGVRQPIEPFLYRYWFLSQLNCQCFLLFGSAVCSRSIHGDDGSLLPEEEDWLLCHPDLHALLHDCNPVAGFILAQPGVCASADGVWWV